MPLVSLRRSVRKHTVTVGARSVAFRQVISAVPLRQTCSITITAVVSGARARKMCGVSPG